MLSTSPSRWPASQEPLLPDPSDRGTGDFSIDVLDALADMVLIKGPGSRIVWANRAFREYYGMSNDTLRGIIDAPFNDPDYTQQYVKDDAVVFTTGEVLNLEEPATRHDGVVRLFHTMKSPIRDESGRITMLVAVCRDITERRNLENSLGAATRMAAIGALAAGIAHEINNPLMYTMAHVEHMLAAVRAKRPVENLEALLTDVEDGLLRVQMIVRGLQTFSREDGARRPVDIRRVVDWATKFASNEIRQRARLVLDCSAAADVCINESQFGQVMLNLLVNAAHAIPEGDVSGNEIRVITKMLDGSVCVEVSDTGLGIAPDYLDRVFDPFFTTKTVGSGAGLGLSIVRSVVTAHDGKVEVESTPGKGSVFRILLPRSTRREVTAPVVPSTPPASTQRLRVLVIDDEPVILSVVKRALTGEHDVVTMSDARLAIEAYEAGDRYDVVVSDLMMPAMSGMDFFDKLAAVAPGQERRVVFLTGGAFTERARAFVEGVGNPVIDKPCTGADLRAAVRAAHERVSNEGKG